MMYLPSIMPDFDKRVINWRYDTQRRELDEIYKAKVADLFRWRGDELQRLDWEREHNHS